ncbi:DNA-directed RNA polymerase sigma-70 factor [Streptomyces ruber]|uniref:DNA-directed RNA polymerase sigma-70 factor n=2 Tax=Streptomyces TaxID=1883 RepID=A0A918EQR3_9ACTN|nr:sigma factor-like helix-turn-helix DNA-binding protein [Streptomyces ruber]GGQ40601.1 DNA-directed RNA polymerase sigma-70 factor [Streptomyces ruber]
MRERQASEAAEARRAREFEAFVAGAAGRLLHAATLLTAEPPDDNPRARRLLTLSLASTYASWDRLHGEDPYDRTRRHLVLRFADGAWPWYGRRRPGRRSVRFRPPDAPAAPAALSALTPRQRLVVVLRLFEGVAEEQTAALLGLPADRVRALCARATADLLRPPRGRAPAAVGAARS